MDYQRMEQLIKKYASEYLDKPGEVFFSSKTAFKDNNGVMFIGLNPGGNKLPPIRNHLKSYWKQESTTYYSTNHYSGFLDQCWHEPEFSEGKICKKCEEAKKTSNGCIEPNRHQKRVREIAKHLGIDLRKSVSTNAIWIQTRDAITLSGEINIYKVFSESFFPIFLEIFKETKPKLVICLGNGVEGSSFGLFHRAIETDKTAITSVANFKNGKFFQWQNSHVGKIIFFGTPHPSRFELTSKGLDLLKEMYSKFRV